MARILIRENAHELEVLMGVVVERAGHEAVALGSRPDASAAGDVLLVAPDSRGALEWTLELRRRRPDLPVVCVGPTPEDPLAGAFKPAAIVPKPFRLAELRAALDEALHAR